MSELVPHWMWHGDNLLGSRKFSMYINTVGQVGMNKITRMVNGLSVFNFSHSRLIEVLCNCSVVSSTLCKSYSVNGLCWSVFYDGRDNRDYLERVLKYSSKTDISEFVNLCAAMVITDDDLSGKSVTISHKYINTGGVSAETNAIAREALEYLYENHPESFDKPLVFTNIWLLTYHSENTQMATFKHLPKARQRDCIFLFPQMLKCFTLDDVINKFSFNGQEWSRILYQLRSRTIRSIRYKYEMPVGTNSTDTSPIAIPVGMVEWINRQCFVGKIKSGKGNKSIPDYQPYVVEVELIR